MKKNAVRTFEAVARVWCQAMHTDITWPIHGHYRCRKCDRRYPVPWERADAGSNAGRREPRRVVGRVQPEFAAAA